MILPSLSYPNIKFLIKSNIIDLEYRAELLKTIKSVAASSLGNLLKDFRVAIENVLGQIEINYNVEIIKTGRMFSMHIDVNNDDVVLTFKTGSTPYVTDETVDFINKEWDLVLTALKHQKDIYQSEKFESEYREVVSTLSKLIEKVGLDENDIFGGDDVDF